MTSRRYTADLIRQSVTAREVAVALGLSLSGDFRCACPFHNGHDKNMKLYDGDRGYYCFVCHQKGDVISLAQGVLGCTFTEAIKWLSDTFHLSVGVDVRPSNETLQRAEKRARTRKELHRLEREAEGRSFDTFLSASDFIRQLEQTIDECAPDTPDAPWSKRFCMALKLMPEARAVAEEAAVRMMERSKV